MYSRLGSSHVSINISWDTQAAPVRILVPFLNRSFMKLLPSICCKVIVHKVLLEFYYLTVIISTKRIIDLPMILCWTRSVSSFTILIFYIQSLALWINVFHKCLEILMSLINCLISLNQKEPLTNLLHWIWWKFLGLCWRSAGRFLLAASYCILHACQHVTAIVCAGSFKLNVWKTLLWSWVISSLDVLCALFSHELMVRNMSFEWRVGPQCLQSFLSKLFPKLFYNSVVIISLSLKIGLLVHVLSDAYYL